MSKKPIPGSFTRNDTSSEYASEIPDLAMPPIAVPVKELVDTEFVKRRIQNIQYDIADDLVGGKVYTSSTEYSTITSVVEQPDFVQYTGSILSTTKTNNLQIDDPDTVIIRINMVKGM